MKKQMMKILNQAIRNKSTNYKIYQDTLYLSCTEICGHDHSNETNAKIKEYKKIMSEEFSLEQIEQIIKNGIEKINQITKNAKWNYKVYTDKSGESSIYLNNVKTIISKEDAEYLKNFENKF